MGNLARDRSNNAETGFFDCIEESQPCDQPAVILIRHYFRSGFYSWCALRFYLADLLFYVVSITTDIIICCCFQMSKAQEAEWLLQMRLSWREIWHGKREAWRPYRIHYVMIYPDWQKRNRYLILESSVCFSVRQYVLESWTDWSAGLWKTADTDFLVTVVKAKPWPASDEHELCVS